MRFVGFCFFFKVNLGILGSSFIVFLEVFKVSLVFFGFIFWGGFEVNVFGWIVC